MDPFRHHPELRARIKPLDPEGFFRTATAASIKAMMEARGIEAGDRIYDDATREALRVAALAGHEGDLWVFAYGSLMWDPALDFAELRRAHAPGHERRFILVDTYGGRGTAASPGLMAALDEGSGCAGLAFRIAAEKVEVETRHLFLREMIMPAYLARFIPLETAHGPIEALAFLADHADELMVPDISFETQVRYLANGEGFMGSSLDYLRNVVAHLHDMDIPDPALDRLLAAAEAEAAQVA